MLCVMDLHEGVGLLLFEVVSPHMYKLSLWTFCKEILSRKSFYRTTMEVAKQVLCFGRHIFFFILIFSYNVYRCSALFGN